MFFHAQDVDLLEDFESATLDALLSTSDTDGVLTSASRLAGSDLAYYEGVGGLLLDWTSARTVDNYVELDLTSSGNFRFGFWYKTATLPAAWLDNNRFFTIGSGDDPTSITLKDNRPGSRRCTGSIGGVETNVAWADNTWYWISGVVYADSSAVTVITIHNRAHEVVGTIEGTIPGWATPTYLRFGVMSYTSAITGAYSAIDNFVYAAGLTPALDGWEDALVIDHTTIADFPSLPAAYRALALAHRLLFTGESHSAAYREGLALLETLYAAYASSATESGTPEAARSDALRIDRLRWGGATYDTVTQEQNLYTNATAVAAMKAALVHDAAQSVAARIFGHAWCWTMTWDGAGSVDIGGTTDPVLACRWTGCSRDGPEGDRVWGLDARDDTLTSNTVCVDTYLGVIESIRRYAHDEGLPTEVVFTTGPVDEFGGSTEQGYARWLKHEHIRDYVAEHGGILFDYADILSYSNAGAVATSSWTDGGSVEHVFNEIHADNLTNLEGGYENDVGHIGSTGAVRIAKALWLLDAYIEGWDGTPGTTTYTVTYNSNGSTGGIAPTDASSPYDEDDVVTVLGNTGSLVRTGYVFTGWNTAADGSGTAYDPADTFEMPAANVTLYAQWLTTPSAVTATKGGSVQSAMRISL